MIGTGIGGAVTLLDQDDLLEGPGLRKVSPLTVPMLMPNGPAAWVGLEFKARAGVHSPVSACASGRRGAGLGGADAARGRGRRRDRRRRRGLHHRHHRRRVRAGPHALAAQRRARSARPGRSTSERDGFVLGEGAGHHDPGAGRARRRPRRHGARALAGYGITADAYHITGPDPEGSGQTRAMRKAVADAGLTAADIVHVNCHATSTVAGDPGEAKAVQQALGDHVVLTAPKSALGHTVGAAGAVESIVTLLSIRDGVIPATLNLEKLDPGVELDVVAGRAAQGRASTPRCATRSGSAGTTSRWRSPSSRAAWKRAPAHAVSARRVSRPGRAT